MNEDTDLTEKRYFRNKYKDPLSVKRNFPRLPWKVSDDEFTDLLKNKSDYEHYQLEFDTDNNFNYIITSNYPVNYWIKVDKNTKYSSSNVKNKYKNFPTGKVGDIRLYNNIEKDASTSDNNDLSIAMKRKNDLLKRLNENDKYDRIIHCCKCNRVFTISELLFNEVSNKEHFGLFCDECYQKAKKESKLIKPEEMWYKLENNASYRKYNRRFSIRGRLLPSSKISIPCLSSDIKPHKCAKYKINEMQEYYHYYEEKPLNFTIRENNGIINRENCVSYKGRGELRWRESEWQPKGRVSQPYDDIFEDINWQNMLKYRLGLIDSIIDSDSHDIITKENTINMPFDDTFTFATSTSTTNFITTSFNINNMNASFEIVNNDWNIRWI